MGLKNITLRTRLWLNLAVMVVLFGLAIVVYQFALNTADRQYQKAIDDELSMKSHAQNIQFYMLQCRRAEKDFLLRKDKKYLAILEGHVASLQAEAQSFSSIAMKAGHQDNAAHAEEISRLANDYLNSFKMVYDAHVVKGLDHNSGLQGSFREAVHRIQEKMPEHSIADLYEGYLTIRRYEKDFYRTGNSRYNTLWNNAMRDYKTALDQSGVDKTSREAQLQSYSRYRNAANRYSRSRSDANYQRVRSEAQNIETAIRSVYVPNAGTLTLEIRKNEKDYLLRGDEKYVAATHQSADKLLDAFKGAGILPDHIEEIQKDLEAYKMAFDKLVSEDKIIAKDIQLLREAVHKIEEKVEPLVTDAENEAREVILVTETQAQQLSNWAIVAAFLALIIGSLMVALNIRTILAQLGGDPSEIAAIANKLAEGQFDIETSSKKYTGVFAELMTMTAAIRSAIRSIQKTMLSISNGDLTQAMDEEGMRGELVLIKDSVNKSIEMLSHTISQVMTATDQVNSGASQISSASQALASGTTEQAASLEEISSSMSEVDSRAKANKENASQAADLSAQAMTIAERGDVQMKEMLSAMDKINRSSEDISKIIKVIDEIAFQTNLLALNAAVEAARAGKYGKGFAVVADEVRNLAARSAEAAKNTTELIENSVKEVDMGVSNAGKTAEVLKEINDSITKINDLVGEIASASQEQSANTDEINSALSQVNDVIQQNSSISEEAASASEELSSQSTELQGMMRRFKVSESSTVSRSTSTEQPPSLPKSPGDSGKHSPKMITLDDRNFGDD